MPVTLFPPPPLRVAALPTASPVSGPPADFQALLPDTGALLAAPDNVRVPGAVPTACALRAPPVPLEQGLLGPALADPDVVLPGSAALSEHPEQSLALAGSLCPQTGSGRRCSDRQETLPADQSSAGAVRPRSVHSARFLAVMPDLCVPLQAAPLDSAYYSLVIAPDSLQILPTRCTLVIYCASKCPTCQWAAESGSPTFEGKWAKSSCDILQE